MRVRTGSSLTALALSLAVTGGTHGAHAFCRTTTCDPSDRAQQCIKDARGCVTSGLPLYWRGRCLSFGVQKDGSRKRRISYETALDTIKQGYVQWLNADCSGGQHPSLQLFVSDDPLSCDRQEYNQDDGNANVWIFRDESWPHPAGAHQLALTTLTYNVDDGEIFDVDVEINTFQNQITVGDTNIEGDLASIVTHEAGHFFGLSHSDVRGATMTPSYEFGETILRSLEQDDIDGICSLYPPGRRTPSCELTKIPRHGFSTECGVPGGTDESCTVARAPAAGGAGALGALALAALSLIRRRPRSRSRPDRRFD